MGKLGWEHTQTGNVVRHSGEWTIVKGTRTVASQEVTRFLLLSNGRPISERKTVEECEEDAQAIVDDENSVLSAPTDAEDTYNAIWIEAQEQARKVILDAIEKANRAANSLQLGPLGYGPISNVINGIEFTKP